MDAVLLASGFSRRFGNADKLLVLFREKPLARYTLELTSGLGRFREIFFIAAS
ncbi:MAG: NTP transferase domain-containing protein, partial [Treponema sp.]|nr:NTP transferase domain-containing protein [Treponema sp.]